MSEKSLDIESNVYIPSECKQKLSLPTGVETNQRELQG